MRFISNSKDNNAEYISKIKYTTMIRSSVSCFLMNLLRLFYLIYNWFFINAKEKSPPAPGPTKDACRRYLKSSHYGFAHRLMCGKSNFAYTHENLSAVQIKKFIEI